VAEMFAGKAQIFESVEVQLIMWSGISYPGGIVYVLTSAYMSSRSSDGMQRNVEISESAILPMLNNRNVQVQSTAHDTYRYI